MKILRWGNSAVTMFALALMYVPLLAVALFSFNSSKIGFIWGGFTLQWYEKLLQNEDVLLAVSNTFILAGVSTVIATVLGTLLAWGMSRFPWSGWTERAYEVSVYIPVITPDIIFAAAMVVFFALLRQLTGWFDAGMTNMIIAHVTFQIAFVCLVVRGRLVLIGPTVEEAARDLYASNWYIFRRILLPLTMPGIVAGALLAFTLSLDDFIISFVTKSPDSATLPIYIYSSVKRGISPELHAASTAVFMLTVLLVVGAQVLSLTLGRRFQAKHED